MDPLKPSPQVLIALGSIIVHYEEWTSKDGADVDKIVIDTVRTRPEVEEWFREMRAMVFLPLKRSER